MLRAWNGFVLVLAWVAALLIGAMALHIGYDVAARYFFNAPTSWSNDLSEYSLLWATFFAGPWLVRNGGHVRIDILVERLPSRASRVLAVAIALMATVICLIGAWETAVETWDYWRRGTAFAKVWAVPQWLPYVAMPIGFAAMAVEFTLSAGRSLRNFGPPAPRSRSG